MDKIDREILMILSENAAVTATEMVPRLNLSIPAINKRIQKLQNSGIIRRFTVEVDREKVGKPLCAFMLLVLQPGAPLDVLMKMIRSDPDILECHGITGEYDYLLKVCTADMASLQKKINQLKRAGGIVKSHTMFSLSEFKHTLCPVPDALPEERELQ